MTTISRLPDRKESLSFCARLLCLLTIATVEFLLMAAGKRIYVEHRRLMQLGIIGSLAVFWGVSLWRCPRRILRRDVCLGILTVEWFLIVEVLHRINHNSELSIFLFLSVYLIALPFAALTDDAHRQIGIRVAAWIYLAAAAYLIAWGIALFVKGEFSGWMRYFVLWSEGRLRIMHHPNRLARIFMITICLSMGVLERAKRFLTRGLLLGFTGLLFIGLVLTNSRACVLVTCLLLGANLFFRIKKSSTRRLILALLAAAVLAAVTFLAAKELFRWNSDRLLNPDPVADTVVTTDGTPPPAPQGSWTADMPTLNNRTLIWTEALKKIQNDPWILLCGTNDTEIQTGFFVAPHSHNAWLETLLRLGLPGLLLSLVFSWRVGWASLHILWHPETGLWKKNIAMMALAMMVTSMLEPFLFVTITENHFFDFIFFLCLGYLTLWSRELKEKH